MSTPSTQTPPAAKPEKPKAKAAPKAKTILVLDTTATPAGGPRIHEQLVNGQVRQFTFKPGEPLEMPIEVAVKFLRFPAFLRVNEKGEPIAYTRQPKQPEELQAGEQIELSEHETIARFDEITSKALLQRAMELPGGERFAAAGESGPDREAMIAFLVEKAKERRKANIAAKPDIGADEFFPEPEEMEAA